MHNVKYYSCLTMFKYNHFRNINFSLLCQLILIAIMHVWQATLFILKTIQLLYVYEIKRTFFMKFLKSYYFILKKEKRMIYTGCVEGLNTIDTSTALFGKEYWTILNHLLK